MRRFTAFGLATAIMLTGCAGMNYAMQNYSGVPVQSFQTEGGSTFRIFDKPVESRLMITPTVAGSAGIGAVRGGTLGMVQAGSSEVIYRDAAEAFLKSTGRSCRALDVSFIVTPQYEVRYQC